MRHWMFGALAALMLTPLAAFAHGEDKPGPHGGVIRMPGAFHTEVVAHGDRAFHVYLLDVAFKDPVVADSTVALWYVAPDGKTVEVGCVKGGDHFGCRLPEAVPAAPSGALKLRATRKGLKGSDVSYPLPLKAAVPEQGHHKHDSH